ncbi:intradiol ring-cleavage dioxygenase [Paraburkholderia strydomiana]|uniref:intradiol ring-cleavage dioxygenase n=1 Tax=Paraburkholderia strydomiana TaxID=1245417 RepID=UPI001BE81691|nr:intradiol ring-cleavage dioxygenase [Paraburkholderia strydomiana]MBT2790110.1 intradiol ring-cleavage dioxygenase [Paraburkholderia strydomiana]
MQNLDENSITGAVIASHECAPDGRLKAIVSCLVHHLHAFAREVGLTESEWDAGIRFLTDVGHATHERRQEFVLLSDTLGLSMLVTAMAHPKPDGCTEATVFGPFFVDNAPAYQNGDDIANGAIGEPCFVSGVVQGPDGQPLDGARIEVWQADADGLYDVQHASDQEQRARGVLHTGPDGRYFFRSIVAEPYPIPHDGPVGRMLRALGRHPWRPAHLHFMITAPGYDRLVTHVFREGDRYLDCDAVFGVRSSLIAPWIRHEGGRSPDGTMMSGPFSTLDFDFILSRSQCS